MSKASYLFQLNTKFNKLKMETDGKSPSKGSASAASPDRPKPRKLDPISESRNSGGGLSDVKLPPIGKPKVETQAFLDSMKEDSYENLKPEQQQSAPAIEVESKKEVSLIPS